MIGETDSQPTPPSRFPKPESEVSNPAWPLDGPWGLPEALLLSSSPGTRLLTRPPKPALYRGALRSGGPRRAPRQPLWAQLPVGSALSPRLTSAPQDSALPAHSCRPRPRAHRAPEFPWPRLLWRGADHSTCRLPRPARRPRNTGLPGTLSSEPGGLLRPWGAPLASASAGELWLLSRPHTSVRSRLQTRAFNPPQHQAAPRAPGPRRTPGPGCPPELWLYTVPTNQTPGFSGKGPSWPRWGPAAGAPRPLQCLTARSLTSVHTLQICRPPGQPWWRQWPRHISGAEKPGRGLALHPVGRIQMQVHPAPRHLMGPGCRTTCSILLKVSYSQIQTILIL